MTDDERRRIEAMAAWDPAGQIMTPVTEPEALNMFVIHALRDMSRQQAETNNLIMAIQSEMRAVSDKMIKWETNVEKIEKLEKKLESLVADQQRRAGMQLLVDWLAKHVPWLLAFAAAVWALKIDYRP